MNFYVGNNDFKEEFTLDITNKGYTITHKNGAIISIRFSRGREMLLRDFLEKNPPTIWFVDGSSLEGNLLVMLKTARPATFPSNRITPWNWAGINIKKESQGTGRAADSIQYKLISELKVSGKYCLIFDDDDSGEIADVIAIQEDCANSKLMFELYHCKFSSEPKAGARIGDLYEVCGQAENTGSS